MSFPSMMIWRREEPSAKKKEGNERQPLQTHLILLDSRVISDGNTFKHGDVSHDLIRKGEAPLAFILGTGSF